MKSIAIAILIVSSTIRLSSDLGNGTTVPITVQNLSKKWKLDKYSYSIYTENPPEREQNDYLHLKSNLSFIAVSEGLYESGHWRLDAQNKRIYLSQPGEEGEWACIIDHLSSDQLIIIMDDPSDSEIQHVRIHYKH